MGRTHLYVLSGLLAAIGCGFFAYKLLVLGFPLQPEARTDVWRVEVQFQFDATEGRPRRACSCRGAPGTRDRDQSFVSPGLRCCHGSSSDGHGMRAAFSIPKPVAHRRSITAP